MPIQYSSIADEHLAVRRSVGMFDVSHMAELRVQGENATELLRYAALNDVAKLKPGRGHYSMLANDQGGLIDDVYIYCELDGAYLVVANAANAVAVYRHLSRLASLFQSTVTDESANWALIAVQGPDAQATIEPIAEYELATLKKNRFADTELVGQDVRIARTGYTGEDGFELFVRPQGAEALWRALESAGAIPCGLGARDTLRLEAGFPLFGQDLNERTNPLCTPFAWVVKDKTFYGREQMWDPKCDEQLVGLELVEQGIPRPGYEVLDGDRVAGRITSGTLSPLTRKGIAFAWVEAASSQIGYGLSVQIRGQKKRASVVSPPFYP